MPGTAPPTAADFTRPRNRFGHVQDASGNWVAPAKPREQKPAERRQAAVLDALALHGASTVRRLQKKSTACDCMGVSALHAALQCLERKGQVRKVGSLKEGRGPAQNVWEAVQ